MIVGQGKHRYEVVEGWEQLPNGWSHGDVAGVATDSQDRVYVFNRSPHPVIVYDREGKFLDAWGDETLYPRAHGITIVNDEVYLVDARDQTVRKCTLDGKVLMTLGTPGQVTDTGYVASAPHNLTTITRAAGPFNVPTRLAAGPSGDLYVSDGYGNARVHRYSADGKLLQSWGEPGTGPGQFNLVHSVWVHTDGRVFICDRENDRVQIFGPTGDLLDIWTHVTRPGDLFISKDGTVYIGEMGWEKDTRNMAGKLLTEDRPSRLTVRDIQGNILSTWGGPDPCAIDGFSAPHGLWVDSRGDIYVGEVTQTALSGFFKRTTYHAGCHSLIKFAKI
ncbi:MAG: peptidyl-alpha-hydroxyglycine alpha-amidating lyase family protein [Chloroflexota bacterium]